MDAAAELGWNPVSKHKIQPEYGEGFNDWGGRGYYDFIPGKVTKTAPSGDMTT